MIPLGRPGPMTEQERFQFDTAGYLVIPGALSPEETQACLEAARRLHAAHPPGQWRQLGATYEQEPAMERLMDHPSVLPKVRALLGDHFILYFARLVKIDFLGSIALKDVDARNEVRPR